MQNLSFKSGFFGRRIAWATLIIVTLITLAIVLIPVWTIHPFRLQTSEGLKLSYTLRNWSPILTLMVFVIALALVICLWHGTRRWRSKLALVVVFIPILTATWFARQNYFEWMFAPLPNASYVKIDKASFVSDSDMVLVIELNGDAAAYPVRQVAYHHLVQDIVGGIPVVVTY